MTAAAAVLTFVTLERLAELWLARRNTQALLRRGAMEFGASHYPFIVSLHAAWLAGLWALAFNLPVNLAWLVVFAVLQVGRLWVITALGPRWTTRIVVLPEATLVAAGPYKYLSHPNYAVVAAEIAALPLAFGLIGFALVFSVLNAGVLFIRIRVENAALSAATNRR